MEVLFLHQQNRRIFVLNRTSRTIQTGSGLKLDFQNKSLEVLVFGAGSAVNRTCVSCVQGKLRLLVLPERVRTPQHVRADPGSGPR